MRRPRAAITIILNGLHHLKHDNYARRLAQAVDYWVLVEGAAQSNGSTSWCKVMPPEYHLNGSSVDGTLEYILDLSNEYSNVHVVRPEGMWKSKDDQVNAGVDRLRRLTTKAFLWQIDADEQWTAEQMIEAEDMLLASSANTAIFQFHHFVGTNLIAIGEWGSGWHARLWKWHGEDFQTHEPPVLTCGQKIRKLPQKHLHFAYYFPKDVEFKAKWYRGHEYVWTGWQSLQKETKWPQPISRLFGEGKYGHTKSVIVPVEEYLKVERK
jgi:hypothetical protein